MNLYEKLEAATALLSSILEELRPSQEEEPESEVLLTRSQRNRRSEKNEVLTMVPLNGAPTVPESWKGRGGTRSGSGEKNRLVLAKIMDEYEPLTRPEIWNISREVDPRLRGRNEQKNFQQMVNRMLRLGKVRMKRDKLVMGKV